MARHVRLREFLAAVEGIALMRGMFTGTDADAQRRIDELRSIVSADDAAFTAGIDVPALDVSGGYERWSSTYDAPGNPLISDLTVRRCIEATFTPDEVKMQEPASTLFPQAAEAAFLGLPAAIVWDVTVTPASRR